MKTPRLVSLCFGILTLATLLHAEPPASTSKEEGLAEKMPGLYRGIYSLWRRGYCLATTRNEVLEKELARNMKLSTDEVHALLEKGIQCDDLLVHGLTLLGHGELTKADEAFDKVLAANPADSKRLRQTHEGKGLIAFDKRDCPTALIHYQSALALSDKVTEDQAWVSNATCAAYALDCLKRYKEEEALLREILSLAEEKTAPNHGRVVIPLENLAAFLMKTNQLEEAEKLIRSALAIEESVSGKEHPRVASLLDKLGCLLSETNHLEEAEECCLGAFAIFESAFGMNCADVASVLKHLSLLYVSMKRFTEVGPLLMEAQRIEQDFCGKEPSDSSDTQKILKFIEENLKKSELK